MEKEKCRSCEYYIAYYRQLSGSYARLKNGYCNKNKTEQKQTNFCEYYKSNLQKEKRSEKLRYELLEQAAKSINEILQILKEKQDFKR